MPKKYFYDANRLLLGEQDPLGYVTEYSFDVAGRMTQKIRYATPTVSAATLAAARPVPDPLNDVHRRYSYDANGWLIEEHDPLNDVHSRYFYDANGLLVMQHDLLNDVRHCYFYDANGQRVGQQDPLVLAAARPAPNPLNIEAGAEGRADAERPVSSASARALTEVGLFSGAAEPIPELVIENPAETNSPRSVSRASK